MLHKRSLRKIIVIGLFFLFLFAVPDVFAQEINHIEDLFGIRESIAGQGLELPDLLREAEGPDVRTLERIFELNTSALTTIEAYFRIFRIAFTSEGGMSRENLEIANEWLRFIQNQCSYDLDYINATLQNNLSPDTQEQLTVAGENIEKLSTIAQFGIEENQNLIR